MNKKFTLLLTLIISFIFMDKVNALFYGVSGTTFSGLTKNCSSANCSYDSKNRLILQARLYYVDQGSFTQIGSTVYYTDSNTYDLLKNTELNVKKMEKFDTLLTNEDKYEEAKKAIGLSKVTNEGKELLKTITGMENYEEILRKDSNPWSDPAATKGYRIILEPAFIVINPTFSSEKYGMITSRGKMIEYLRGKLKRPTLSLEENKFRNRSPDVGIPTRTEDQCKTATSIQYADMQYGCGYRMADVDHYTDKTCYGSTTSTTGNTTCINYDENNVSKYSELFYKAACTSANKTNTKYGSYISNNGTCKLYCKEELILSFPGNISNPQLRGSYFAWPSFEENSLYKMSIKSSMSCTILDEGGTSRTVASTVTSDCPDGYVSYNATTCRSKTDKKDKVCPADYPLLYNGKCYKGKPVCDSGWTFIDSYCYKMGNASYTDKIKPVQCTGTNVRFVDQYCYPVTPAKTEKLVDPKDKVCPSGSYNVNGKCYTSRRGRDWHQGSSYYDTCDPCGTHYFGDATYCSQPSGWSAGTCSRCDKMSGTARTQCLKNCTPAHATCPSGWTPDNKVGVNPACIKKASCSSCGGSLWSDGMCHIYKTNPGYYYCSSGVESGDYCYSSETSKVCPSDHPIESNGKCYKKQTTSPYCDAGLGNHINDTAPHVDAEGNIISLKGTCVGQKINPCPNGKLITVTENGKNKRRCDNNCSSGVDDTVNNVKKCVSCEAYGSLNNTSSMYHKYTANWEKFHKYATEVNKTSGTFNLQGKCTYSPKASLCDKSTFVNGQCITGTAQNRVCESGYVEINGSCYKKTSKVLKYSCPVGYTISGNNQTCTKTCKKEVLNASIESLVKANPIQVKLTAGDNQKIDENLKIYSDETTRNGSNVERVAKFKIAENKNRYFNKETGAVTSSGTASSQIFDRGQGVVSLKHINEILEGSQTKDYKLTLSNIKAGVSKKFDIKNYTCKFSITESNMPCKCPSGTKNEGNKISDILHSLGIAESETGKCAELMNKYCNYVPTKVTCKNSSNNSDVVITSCVNEKIKNKTLVEAIEICTENESKCTNDYCVSSTTGEKISIKDCLAEGNSRKVCNNKYCCTNTNSCGGNCTSKTKKISDMIYKTTSCSSSSSSCSNGKYCNFEVYCENNNNTSMRALTCIEEELNTTNIVQALNKNEITLTSLESAIKKCKPVICEKGPIALFRVIDLNHPFPGTDGGSRMAGFNWDSEEVIKTKITNARNASGYKLYQKEPLMRITLTPNDVKTIRAYNKNKSYSNFDLKCVSNNTSGCVSKFIHSKEVVNLNVKYNDKCGLNLSATKEQFDKCYNSNN